ncbi:hypothetical protein ERJ75_001327500 [Trypanosoma vivax]|nr:hypothetical protein ERJ75_001327500 [Trypanosoma vivax]
MKTCASKAASLAPSATQRSTTCFRRLYNVCLWQRRHPLFILCPVLDAFGGTHSCEVIDDMLEGLSQHIATPLGRASHLLRGDVLTVYPTLAPKEQEQLVEELIPGYPGPGSGDGPAPPPEFYIGAYVSEVPPRFGAADLLPEQYTQLRDAFGEHRRACVQRLLSSRP